LVVVVEAFIEGIVGPHILVNAKTLKYCPQPQPTGSEQKVGHRNEERAKQGTSFFKLLEAFGQFLPQPSPDP
jgi:hypothetical protein